MFDAGRNIAISLIDRAPLAATRKLAGLITESRLDGKGANVLLLTDEACGDSGKKI
jgi:hypothetical protein